ncbi:MAG: outer membrane beta-barrel protein [Bacteroidaceae bacterium]|nr:outer membrane beta-barrel protein [Bacteroidaceae bacterium]
MKRLLTLMALMLCMAVVTQAQKVRFRIEGGMNLSGIRTNDDRESNPRGLCAGWQICGTVSYEFKKHITLISGLTLMHTQRNAKFSPWYGGYFPKAEVKTNQLVLPLKAGYSIHIGKLLRITPSAGLFASYHISGGDGNMNHHEFVNGELNMIKARWNPMHDFSYYSYAVNEKGEESGSYISNITSVRHWTWGAVGGINATIKNHYTVSLQYMEDIKRIQKDLNFRDYSMMLSVGYKF